VSFSSEPQYDPGVLIPDPVPDQPTDAAMTAARHRQADLLRACARELRVQASELPEVLRRIDAYDRPDVWEGHLAARSRAEMAEITRRITSPGAGAAAGLTEAAARMEARAAALDGFPAGPAW